MKKGILKTFIFTLVLLCTLAFSFAFSAKTNVVKGTGESYLDFTVTYGDKFSVQTVTLNNASTFDFIDTSKINGTTVAVNETLDSGKYYVYITALAKSGQYFEGTSTITGLSSSNIAVHVNGIKANSAFIGTEEDAEGSQFPQPSDVASENIRLTAMIEFDKIVFDANGGTGTLPEATYIQKTLKYAAPEATLSKTGYVFDGWNTQANYSGTHYAVDQKITVTKNIKLYAQWAVAIQTQPTNASPTVVVSPSCTQTITFQWMNSSDVAVEGQTTATFNGEGKPADDYYCLVTSATGETVKTDSVNVRSVSFNANEGTGTGPDALTNIVGKTVTLPSNGGNFTKTNYKFKEWNTNAVAASGTTYAAGASYTIAADNTTLYVNWEAKTLVTLDSNKLVNTFTYGDTGIEFTPVSASELTTALTNEFVVQYYVNNAWTANVPSNAGSYNVKVTRAEDAVYQSFEKELSNALVIQKKTITIDWCSTTYAYTGSAQTVTATYKDINNANIGLAVAYSGQSTTFCDAGTYNVTVSFNNEETNYALPTTVTKEYKIAKQSVAVVWSETVSSFTYDGTDQSAKISAKYNTNVELNVSFGTAFKDAGDYIATAALKTVEEQNNYTLTNEINFYVIAKQSVAVVWGGAESFTYDGTDQSAKISAKYNTNVELNVGFGTTFKNAGGYMATATLKTPAEENNYTLTNDTKLYEIEKATATIDKNGVTTEYTYNGSEQTVNSGATLNHSETTLTYTNNTFTNVPAGGTQVVTISAVETTNYAAASTTVTITVNKATATINTDGVVKTYTYTGNLQTVNSGATIPSGQTLSYTNNTFTDVPSTGKQTITISAAESTNYNATSEDVVITINKATAEIDTTNFVYIYTYTGSEQTVNSGATIPSGQTLNYSNNTFTDVPSTGKQFITISAVENDNYNATSKMVKIIINKATTVITVDTTPIVKTYGETIVIPTATTNFGSVNCNKVAADLVNVGTYTINYTVTATANYTAASASVSVTINKKQVTVTPIANDFTYNGTDQKASVTATYKNVDNQDVALNVALSPATFKNVGSYTAAFSFATTAESDNYEIATVDQTKEYNMKKLAIAKPTISGKLVANGESQNIPTTINDTYIKFVSGTVSATDPGVYNAEYKLDDTANLAWTDDATGANITLDWEIMGTSRQNAVTDPSVIVECEDGFTAVTKLNASAKDVATIAKTESDKFELESYEQMILAYDVKFKEGIVDKTDFGTSIVTVKLLIPASLDYNKITRLVHYHSATEVESFDFDPKNLKTIDSKLYYVLETSKFSDFVFIYDTTSDAEYLRMELLASLQETLIQLKAQGYTIDIAAEIAVLNTKTTKRAVLEAYNGCLAGINTDLATATSAYTTLLNEIKTLMGTNHTEVLAKIAEAQTALSALETADKDEIVAKVADAKTEVLNAVEAAKVALSADLTTKTNELKAYADEIEGRLNVKFANTNTAIANAETALTNLVNTETAALDTAVADLSTKVETAEDNLEIAIATLKADLVAELAAQTNALEDYLDAIEANLNIRFDDVDAAVNAAEVNLTALVNTETSALDTAVADLSTKVGNVEANLTNAINDLKAELVGKLSDQTTALTGIVNTLETNLNTKFANVESKIAAAQTAITDLVNTETSALDSAVATLDTKVGTAEANLTAAIATLKTDLVAELGTKTADLKAYIDVLEGKLNTKLTAVSTAVANAESGLTTLINTETTDIDSAIATLNSNLGEVEVNLTNALNDLKATLVTLVTDKKAELEQLVSTFRTESKASYETILAKIAETKDAVQVAEDFLALEINDSEEEVTKAVNETKEAVNQSVINLNNDLVEYNDALNATIADTTKKALIGACILAALGLFTFVAVLLKKCRK